MILATEQINLIVAGRRIYIAQKKGNYFIVHETHWQGESDSLRPLSQDEAIEEYENMFEQREEFEDSFPDVKIEEA